MFATLSPTALQTPTRPRTRYIPMNSSPQAPHTSYHTSTYQMFSPPPQSGPLFASSPIQHSVSQDDTATATPSRSSYAQRYASTLSNPLKNSALKRSYTTSASPSARNKRRDAFLNRVKQDRDNGRFENRGEQLIMMEDVAEQKKWREAMRRRADRMNASMDMQELEFEGDDNVDDADVIALDEYISEEQAMEMALFENMQKNQAQQAFGQNQQMQPHGSFSDDEYDDIFTDLADPMAQGQDMDMSG